VVVPACLPTAASTAEAAVPATPTLNPAGIQTSAATATADGWRPDQDCDGQGTHHGAHRKLLSRAGRNAELEARAWLVSGTEIPRQRSLPNATTEILIPFVAGVGQESVPLLHECRPPKTTILPRKIFNTPTIVACLGDQNQSIHMNDFANLAICLFGIEAVVPVE
jgi:hypothetical protein